MLTSQMIKEAAKAAGADACGIAPMSRLRGAPDDMNPKFLFPEAKSVIGFVFRIPRGVQRGIEEGTQFYQYPSMAYGGINEIFAPAVLYQVGKLIEDEGYEAFVYRNTGARGSVSDMDGSPGNTLSPEEQIEINENAKTSTAHHRSVQFTRPTRDDNVAPDLQFQFRLVAVACGLGEIGWSKMLLTPEFGPMQRVMFLFTDAELEPDPMYDGPKLCKMCMKCARECPGGCIPSDPSKGITVNIAGKECTWGDIDVWRCNTYYTAAGKYYNPFVPASVFDDNADFLNDKIEMTAENEVAAARALEAYTPCWVGYAMAKCGGCIRGCVSMLEKNGCLKDKFENPLRTGKAWRLDR